MSKNYTDMMNKWKDWRLSESKINMGSGGYKGDFDSLEDAISRVDRLMKSLTKELAKDKDANYKQQVLELQRLYKRNFIELKVKLNEFKRKNT